MSLQENCFHYWPPLAQFEKSCWVAKNASFQVFGKGKNLKKCHNLAFFSKWLQILYSRWVFQTWATFIFRLNSFAHKQNCWRPICILAKNIFLNLISKVACHILRKNKTSNTFKKCLSFEVILKFLFPIIVRGISPTRLDLWGLKCSIY